MQVQITLADITEKSALRNLLELYSYDFSEIDGTDVDADGLYGCTWLDGYWSEPGRFPFLVRVNGQLAGFVLVRKGSYFPPEQLTGAAEARLIAEFFVLRKYRQRGIGRQVARAIFDRFAGRWEIAEIPENIDAQAFWRKVIAEYTGGNYSEVYLNNENWQGPVQVFDGDG